MPLIPYVYNPDTGKYHALTAVLNGDQVTLEVAEIGTDTAPAYSPGPDEPLCDVALYMAVHELPVLDMTLERWTLLALQASDAVESYCARSFRVAEADPLLLESDPDYGVAVLTPPPQGLQVVVAQMIKVMSDAVRSGNQGLKSEQLRNYSYTVADIADPSSPTARFAGALRPWRRLYMFP